MDKFDTNIRMCLFKNILKSVSFDILHLMTQYHLRLRLWRSFQCSSLRKIVSINKSKVNGLESQGYENQSPKKRPDFHINTFENHFLNVLFCWTNIFELKSVSTYRFSFRNSRLRVFF